MKHFLFIFLFFAFTGEVLAQDNVTYERKRLSIPASKYVAPYLENSKGQIRRTYEQKGWLKNQQRSYQLYIPQGYDPKKSYPLVVVLHGATRTGASVVERWKYLADKVGLVLLGPNSATPQWQLSHDEANIIQGMMEEVVKDVNVDKSRLFLFGHSSGGHLATYMPILKPYLFTAVSVHAGQMRASDAKLLKDLPRKTPIIFLAGQRDTTIPMHKTAKSAQIYAENGHDTMFVEYIGHNHWYYTAATEINSEALSFMGKYTK